MFLVDEHAEGVSGSEVTALVATAMLERYPGATIVHNLICSWAVPEVIREHGGVPIRTRVGHSFIKQVMAETGAVFGGEHSGHYYFRDNYRADSGLDRGRPGARAALAVRRAAVRGAGAVPPLRTRRARSTRASTTRWRRSRRSPPRTRTGAQDRSDGLTVEFDDWWFNVRPSNTEPLLRLNVEAKTKELLEDRTSELLELIRREGGPT